METGVLHEFGLVEDGALLDALENLVEALASIAECVEDERVDDSAGGALVLAGFGLLASLDDLLGAFLGVGRGERMGDGDIHEKGFIVEMNGKVGALAG